MAIVSEMRRKSDETGRGARPKHAPFVPFFVDPPECAVIRATVVSCLEPIGSVRAPGGCVLTTAAACWRFSEIEKQRRFCTPIIHQLKTNLIRIKDQPGRIVPELPNLIPIPGVFVRGIARASFRHRHRHRHRDGRPGGVRILCERWRAKRERDGSANAARKQTHQKSQGRSWFPPLLVPETLTTHSQNQTEFRQGFVSQGLPLFR